VARPVASVVAVGGWVNRVAAELAMRLTRTPACATGLPEISLNCTVTGGVMVWTALASISTPYNSVNRNGVFWAGGPRAQANWMISFLPPNQGIDVG
jgi:hypothetical protein